MEARKILLKDFDKFEMALIATEKNFHFLVDECNVEIYDPLNETYCYKYILVDSDNSTFITNDYGERELVEIVNFIEDDSEPITYNSEKGWDF